MVLDVDSNPAKDTSSLPKIRVSVINAYQEELTNVINTSIGENRQQAYFIWIKHQSVKCSGQTLLDEIIKCQKFKIYSSLIKYGNVSNVLLKEHNIEERGNEEFVGKLSASKLKNCDPEIIKALIEKLCLLEEQLEPTLKKTNDDSEKLQSRLQKLNMLQKQLRTDPKKLNYNYEINRLLNNELKDKNFWITRRENISFEQSFLEMINKKTCVKNSIIDQLVDLHKKNKKFTIHETNKIFHHSLKINDKKNLVKKLNKLFKKGNDEICDKLFAHLKSYNIPDLLLFDYTFALQDVKNRILATILSIEDFNPLLQIHTGELIINEKFREAIGEEILKSFETDINVLFNDDKDFIDNIISSVEEFITSSIDDEFIKKINETFIENYVKENDTI